MSGAAEVLKRLRFYRPGPFVDREEEEAAKRALWLQGDMVTVFVNEGDWIMVEHAIANDMVPK